MNPILVLNIEVEDNNYDINVSPDKREVFIKNEDEKFIDINTQLDNVKKIYSSILSGK